MQKVLILGSTGQLGSALMNEFGNHLVDFNLNGLNSKNIDICNENQVYSAFHKYKPDLVINCVAYTNVEQAEIDPRPAYELNVFAVNNIVEACKDIGAGLVHFSTDYVFGKCQKQVIFEYDEVNPLNNYGSSKFSGEIIVQNGMNKENLPWHIIRTSSLYNNIANTSKGTFILKMLEKLKSNEKVYLNDENHMSPTYAVHLAQYTRNIINQYNGIYHGVNYGIVTPYNFIMYAVKIINDKKLAEGYSEKNIIMDNKAITSTVRPKFSFMSTMHTNLAYKMSTWENALEEFLINNKHIL